MPRSEDSRMVSLTRTKKLVKFLNFGRVTMVFWYLFLENLCACDEKTVHFDLAVRMLAKGLLNEQMFARISMKGNAAHYTIYM